jgi:hypothetical protein
MTQQEIASLEEKVGEHARSPLFAMLAQQYLTDGRAQDALRLCDNGLANFPFYTTGHLVKGKSLISLNLLAEARREFEFVLDFLPGNGALTSYLASIPRGSDETLTVETPAAQKSEQFAPAAPYPSPDVPLASTPPAAVPPVAMPPVTMPEVTEYSPSPTPTAAQYDYGFSSPAAQPLQPSSDYGFEKPAPSSDVEVHTGFPETVPSPPSSFDALTQFGQTTTADTFGSAYPSTSSVPKEDPFGLSSANSYGAFEPPAEIPSFSIPSDAFGTSAAPVENIPATPLAQEEAASFDVYAERKKKELGKENTLSFEDYMKTAPQTELSVPDSTFFQAEEFEPPRDNIGELTEKLQNVPRITPVINFAQKDTTTVSEEDSSSSGMGFVTPTLAEIYAKQGWFDDAIKAYRTLARNKPDEREKFEKRAEEIEEIKKQQPSTTGNPQ